MSSTLIIALIAVYFIFLLVLSKITSRNASNTDFFLAGKNAPWYLVAFGMIGTSLSGITFISIPGRVGDVTDQFSYMQMVLGYFVGYIFIAYVLMPIYYRLQVTSIYTYLDERFGFSAYKTGAFYFLLSRTLGSAIRLLLVANVLQAFLFDALGFPFIATVAISILLIWVYTAKGGMKTIIWTDTLQTTFMMVALVISIILLSKALTSETGESLTQLLSNSHMTQWFFFDDFAMSKHHFLKEFIGGFFITIGMTGMDQDMMQKNLACKNLREAQKNMLSFAAVLTVVNLLFLTLGVLLFLYSASEQLAVPTDALGNMRTDLLFPEIALRSELSGAIGIFFLIGLIAAAYSSADGALTALTTSVCVDFLNIQEREEKQRERLRKTVHVAMSVVLFVVIIILHYSLNLSAINQLIFLAGFTYGPLIGLFGFGLLSRKRAQPWVYPVVAVLTPIVTWFANTAAIESKSFTFSSLLIAFNAVLTLLLLAFGAQLFPEIKRITEGDSRN
ncbi:MAG: hypothetical protein RL226_1221 [Bacteroidota bacterium]